MLQVLRHVSAAQLHASTLPPDEPTLAFAAHFLNHFVLCFTVAIPTHPFGRPTAGLAHPFVVALDAALEAK